ncbi:MAG: 2-phosphosulfolactate phosphatase [Phycisphaerales bacterium]|nr:2-phosphosulfolactate phosphatase [Phycisphaerales bacterium]
MPAPDVPPMTAVQVERPLFSHLVPSLVEPESLRGSVVVVIDALRASTTIAAALAAGAANIVPCLTVEDARAGARRHDTSSDSPTAGTAAGPSGSLRALLGGERAGQRIEGFDLDNSPASYTPERVGGRVVYFTTTNGTAALLHAKFADEVLVGTIANAGAICARVVHDPRPVHLLCAGTRGEVSLDDCLAAGLLAHRLLAGGRSTTGQDGAILCLGAYREAMAHGSGGLLEAMRRSRGGRNLIHIGLDDDIARCSAPDSVGVVPKYDAGTGRITTA